MRSEHAGAYFKSKISLRSRFLKKQVVMNYQFDIDGADGGLGSSELQLLPQTFVLFLGFTTPFFQFGEIFRPSVAIRSLYHKGVGGGECGVFPSASCHLMVAVFRSLNQIAKFVVKLFLPGPTLTRSRGSAFAHSVTYTPSRFDGCRLLCFPLTDDMDECLVSTRSSA